MLAVQSAAVDAFCVGKTHDSGYASTAVIEGFGPENEAFRVPERAVSRYSFP